MLVTFAETLVQRAAAALPPPAELGFGHHLGPLAITLEHEAGRGWSSPELVPLASCVLPVAAGAVQYAIGAFEGLKAYRDQGGSLWLLRPHAHAARLEASARRLCMPSVGVDRFVALCAAVVQAQAAFAPPPGQGSLYVRPLLAAIEPFLGVRAAGRHALMVFVGASGKPGGRKLRVFIESRTIRAAPGGLGAAKTGANYAAGLAALEDARARGYDQVLFLDAHERRFVSEAGTTNIFFVLDDRVCTPPLDDTLLAGVTRDTCIARLHARGMVVEERAMSLDEIATWASEGRLREIFCTGTASSVVGVEVLEGAGLSVTPGGGDVVASLREDLEALQEGRVEAPEGWRIEAATAGAGVLGHGIDVAPRSHADARVFAESWAEAWNRRDLDAVLSHFDEQVVFESPKAQVFAGTPRLEGKAALRAYWERALAGITELHFDIDDVVVDPAALRLVIQYRARLNGAAVHASEHLAFGPNGLVMRGSAHYGAPVSGRD
jgi:branched-chain amino acid aminotransferase